MIQTRLSSKGQVVIPKPIRDALGLQAGTPFRVRLQEQAIVLEPVRTSPIDTLYGKYSGTDLLTELETEHQRRFGMRPRFVLDAWAILAFLQGEEPAASRVRQLLRGAEEKRVDLFVSVVNPR